MEEGVVWKAALAISAQAANMEGLHSVTVCLLAKILTKSYFIGDSLLATQRKLLL